MTTSLRHRRCNDPWRIGLGRTCRFARVARRRRPADLLRLRARGNHVLSLERLAFADEEVALDLGGAAGSAARVLGAVFGAPTVHDPAAVALALSLLDAGMAPLDLARGALALRLGPRAGPDQVVDLLYTNVVGSPPAPAEHAFYVQLLQQGTDTPASLALFAADTARNLDDIDFTGLSSQGLPYLR